MRVADNNSNKMVKMWTRLEIIMLQWIVEGSRCSRGRKWWGKQVGGGIRSRWKLYGLRITACITLRKLISLRTLLSYTTIRMLSIKTSITKTRSPWTKSIIPPRNPSQPTPNSTKKKKKQIIRKRKPPQWSHPWPKPQNLTQITVIKK